MLNVITIWWVHLVGDHMPCDLADVARTDLQLMWGFDIDQPARRSYPSHLLSPLSVLLVQVNQPLKRFFGDWIKDYLLDNSCGRFVERFDPLFNPGLVLWIWWECACVFDRTKGHKHGSFGYNRNLKSGGWGWIRFLPLVLLSPGILRWVMTKQLRHNTRQNNGSSIRIAIVKVWLTPEWTKNNVWITHCIVLQPYLMPYTMLVALDHWCLGAFRHHYQPLCLVMA